MSERSAGIQKFLDEFAAQNSIAEEVIIGSDHPYSCRCTTCLKWWACVGPEETSEGVLSYGPFDESEVRLIIEGSGYTTCPVCGRYVLANPDGSPTGHTNPQGKTCSGGK